MRTYGSATVVLGSAAEYDEALANLSTDPNYTITSQDPTTFEIGFDFDDG